MADPNRKFDDTVEVDKSPRGLNTSSRIGAVLKHFEVMLADSEPKDHAHYVLLERFGGIAQPSPGEGTKHGSLDKAGSAGPPSPEMVLRKHFGMKK